MTRARCTGRAPSAYTDPPLSPAGDLMTEIEIISQAKRYLDGGVADADQVLSWRAELRDKKVPALARALSRRLAAAFIGGEALSTDQVDAIWQACKADEAFSHARRVLKRRYEPDASTTIIGPPADPSAAPTKDELREQLALMTSKDPDLPASVRHDWALQILDAKPATSSAETLGIAGGIFKRRWDWDGRTASLEQSLVHYLAPIDRGWTPDKKIEDHDRNGSGVSAQDGYPAINAAFVCDLLAEQTDDPANAAAYRGRADALRHRIMQAIVASDYWTTATLAEAKFGVGDVAGAETLLRTARTLNPDPWKRRSTAEQIARLGSLRNRPHDETTRVIEALIGDGVSGAAYVESILVGKVGLALSGGGFRASLYHLGVLARLAESDILRHVSALSTVSGGSMVGAAYYLRVRHLLQTNPAPTRDDYVALVEALIADFRHGTNANLRTSLLTDFKACRAILTGDDRVYADRMAAAIWTTLYSRAAPDDPVLASDPQMADLGIMPKGAEAEFHPRYHNIFRTAKVPALVVNATSLNTGHSWHFTTQSMGESPFSIVNGADALPRLRRSYYRDPKGAVVRRATLSQAVGASACVPGLFAPLQIEALYDRYDVRLVDGGVYDNQGALALLQEDCTVFIVSDAAGQLGLSMSADGGHVSPLFRAMDIFQERMRLASFDRLREAKENGQLSGLAYVHMKQDLEAAAIDWKNCEDPSRDGDQLPGGANRNPRTTYGVWKAHQEHLAAIRTDLDAFSDIEAGALMASGYLAMDVAVRRLVVDVPALASGEKTRRGHAWFFDPCIPVMRDAHLVLERHLKAGATQFLRLAQLDKAVKQMLYVGIGVLVALFALLLWLIWDQVFQVPGRWIVLAVFGALSSWLGRKYLGKYKWMAQLTDPLGALRGQARRWVAVVGTWWLATKIVPVLTKRYLDQGRLDALNGQ